MFLGGKREKSFNDFIGFIVPVFGQENDFAYVDHLLIYRAGKYISIYQWRDEQFAAPFSDKNDKIYNYGIKIWSDNGARSGVASCKRWDQLR